MDALLHSCAQLAVIVLGLLVMCVERGPLLTVLLEDLVGERSDAAHVLDVVDGGCGRPALPLLLTFFTALFQLLEPLELPIELGLQLGLLARRRLIELLGNLLLLENHDVNCAQIRFVLDLVVALLFNQLLFQQILGHLASYLLHLLPVPLLFRLLPLEDPISHLLHLFVHQMLNHCWLFAFLHYGVSQLGDSLRGVRPS